MDSQQLRSSGLVVIRWLAARLPGLLFDALVGQILVIVWKAVLVTHGFPHLP